MASPQRGRGTRSAEWQQRQEHIRRESLRQIKLLQQEPNPRRNLRRIELPASTPEIQARFDDALEISDTVLFQAATGAGKSLDIGAMLLEARSDIGRVAMNQPRRDAAEGVCIASCARHNWEFGKDCGYSTSEFKGNRDDTTLQIMTTAILLNKFNDDPALEYYDAVIIDEAHERDLHIDLLFGMVMRAQELRQAQGLKPLKIIVASATVDREKFQEYLGCPDEAVFDVEGRMFPVREHYLREEELYTGVTNRDGSRVERPVSSIAGKKAVEILKTTTSGDILIFMPGIRTIEATMRNLEDAKSFDEIPQGVEVLRLYSADGLAARQEVLRGSKKGGARRVIVSTNMAETSVTVPGIRYVIDGCRKNQPEFDQTSGLEGLKEVPASKAECRQRKGRAGRVAEGDYYSCLTQDRYDQLEEYPQPEILRLELTSVILRMLKNGIKDLEHFKFVDRPTAENIQAALMTLEGLGALDNLADRNLTAVGRQMAELPIEPRSARMLIEAAKHGCVQEVALMSALARESGDILRYRPQPNELANAESALQDLAGTIVKLTTQQQRAEPESYDARRLAKIIEILAEKKARQRYSAPRPGEEAQPISPDAIRDLAKEILLAKQEPLRTGYSSDWLLYIDLMQQYRAAANKENFCFARGLDYDAMLQAQQTYEQLATELYDKGIELDSNPDAQAIIKSLLPAYAPDFLVHQTGGRRGVEYLRVYYSDSDVRISSASAAYDDRPELFVCLDLDPEKGTKTVGRGKTEETIWKYAAGIHPVSAQALYEAMPHRVKREKAKRFELDGNGTIILTSEFTFKNKKGEWSKIGEGTYSEACPEAGATLAGMIVENYRRDSKINPEFFHLPDNQENARYLDQWQQRVGFYRRNTNEDLSLNWTNLTNWYAERIGSIINLEQALSKGSDYYQLDLDVWIDDTMDEKMDQVVPNHVILADIELFIDYSYRPGDPQSTYAEYRQDRNFSAQVMIGQMDYVQIMKLPDDLVKQLRERIPGLNETDRLTFGNYNSLIELKTATEKSYLDNAWQQWSRPEPQSINVTTVGTLPDLASLGCLPLSYTTDWQGQDIISYPACTTQQQYDSASGKYLNQFMVTYFPNQTKANEANQQAIEKKAEIDATEQRRLDRETLLVPAQELYTRVEPRVTAVVKDYNQFGFSYAEAQDLNTQLQEANISIQGRDRWGSTREVDPRKALELLQAIEQTLADREILKQEQTATYALANQLHGEMNNLVNERLLGIRFRHYGVGPERGRTWQDQWQQAGRMLSRFTPGQVNESSNPVEALRLLRELQAALASLELSVSPLQAEFLDMLEASGSAVRLLELRGGIALSSTDLEGQGNTLQANKGEQYKKDSRRITMRLGTGKVMFIRGRELSEWSGSMRTLYAHYQLSDGLYAIGKAGEVFAVQQQRDQLIAQRRLESLQVDYDRGVRPEGMVGYDDWIELSANTAAAEPKSNDSPLAVALRGVKVKDSPKAEEPVEPVGPPADAASLGQLVTAFGGDKGKKKAGAPEPPVEVATQVMETPVRPPISETKPVEAEVMTPELLASFTEQLEVLHQLTGQLKTLGDKPKLQPKDRPSDRDKALLDLYDKLIPGLTDATRNVRGELTASNPRPERMRGLLADLRRRVDNAWDKTGSRVVTGYRTDWTLKYLGAWESIPTAVDTEETAMLAVELGLDKTVLVAAVRAELATLVPRLQKEAAETVLDLPTIVADVANRLD